jgi:hypothetical protein
MNYPELYSINRFDRSGGIRFVKNSSTPAEARSLACSRVVLVWPASPALEVCPDEHIPEWIQMRKAKVEKT